MSAEGKKKRGESGLSKAKSSPFRLNGLAPNRTEIALRGVPADHTGMHKVQGAIGGLLAAKVGYAFTPTHKLVDLVDRSLSEAPTAAKIFETV